MKKFYTKAEKLDKLVEIDRPGKSDLKNLLGIIGTDEAISVYFYENCKNGAWISLLKEAKEFEGLAAENITKLDRFKASYLSEVEEQRPAEVLKIVSSIDAKDPIIKSCFLDMLLKIALKRPEVARESAELAKKYLGKSVYGMLHMIGDTAAKLMVQIAEKHPDKAFDIAEMLLEVRKKQKKEFLSQEIEAKFREYEYKNLVFKYYTKLWELDALRATILLAEIFNNYLKELGEDDYSVQSGFHIRLERLDQIEEKFDRNITATLVGGICEAGRAVIEKQPDKVDELLDYLWGLDKVIFQRIVMYLLRFSPAKTQKKRISSIIGKREFLDLPYCRYEYRLLLRDKIKDIDKETIQVFKNFVDEQGVKDEEKESISAWFEKNENREATDEDFERISNSRKASTLYLLRDVGEFRKIYEKCKEKAEATDEELAPRPMVQAGRRIDPEEGSPLGLGDMVRMEPQRVVEYLNDPSRWEVDKKKESFFHTPEEGLAGTFEKVVQQRIDDYAGLRADELIKLKPVFLSSYFSGSWNALREKKIEEQSIINILERANDIIEKQSENQDYEGVFRSIIYVLGRIFEGEKLRNKLVKENGDAIWNIIDTLARYEDKEGRSDYDGDPHQGSINSVAGEAFTLVVRFGLTWKNEDSKSYEKIWSEKIRGFLQYVVVNVKDVRVGSVLGVWFPQLHWLEEKWISENIDRIFDSDDDEKWDGIWGSYMSWGRAYEKVFKFLASRGKYEEAVKRIGIEGRYKHDKNPDEGMIEHLMIAFFNGWIEYGDTLLQKFFGKAPAKLRGKAAKFLTTGFKPVKEDGKTDKKTIERLKRYWQERLKEIGKNREKNLEEAVEFAGWVKDTLLDEGETFDLLDQTLKLTGGKLGHGRDMWDFVKGVCEIAKGHELMALQCLNRAMADEEMAMDFSLYKKELTELMESIVTLPDDYPDVRNIRIEAVKLADAYGRMHIYEFKGIYKKLRREVFKWFRPKNWKKFPPSVLEDCKLIAGKVREGIYHIGTVKLYNGSISFINSKGKSVAKLMPDNPKDPIVLAGFSKTNSEAKKFAMIFSGKIKERYIIGRPFVISEIPRDWQPDKVAQVFTDFMRSEDV